VNVRALESYTQRPPTATAQVTRRKENGSSLTPFATPTKKKKFTWCLQIGKGEKTEFLFLRSFFFVSVAAGKVR